MDKRLYNWPEVDIIDGLSAKLLEANQALKRAEEERSEFLSNISHDLRAPLTAVRSAVDSMKEMEEDEEWNPKEFSQLVKLIDVRTKVLEELVNDLFYLTSIEYGRLELKKEEVPLEAFLEEYFCSVLINSKYAKRKLKFQMPENLSCMVSIDVNRMTRVLDNLFVNALKYSEDGAEIELGAYRVVCEEKEQKVAFYVRDTGIGIPEDKVEKVFDRLYKVSDARTPSEKTGSGLGLAIVKEIVEKHGGTIQCESVLGKGSTFTVTIVFHNRYTT